MIEKLEAKRPDVIFDGKDDLYALLRESREKLNEVIEQTNKLSVHKGRNGKHKG